MSHLALLIEMCLHLERNAKIEVPNDIRIGKRRVGLLPTKPIEDGLAFIWL
jgi:hypothetical protein